MARRNRDRFKRFLSTGNWFLSTGSLAEFRVKQERSRGPRNSSVVLLKPEKSKNNRIVGRYNNIKREIFQVRSNIKVDRFSLI
jgi:hypothetical protein